MHLKPTVFRGYEDYPAVIFIHGLGMDENIWVNPSKSRIFAGGFPISTILGNKPKPKVIGICEKWPIAGIPKFSVGKQAGLLQTLFHDLSKKGYTVVTWSQKRPDVPMDSVVRELKEIVDKTRSFTKAGIILVGHSRGGLIGRKYLMSRDRVIRGLITASTPHKGTSIAKLARYISPLVSLIRPLFPNRERGILSFTIKSISEFLRSKALKELLPDSDFFRSLKDRPCKGVSYISICGTNPTLFRLYRWKLDVIREDAHMRRILKPEELFSIPDVFEKVIPLSLYPEEMKQGKGDCLVSAESAQIPWYNEHYTFHVNHAEVLFDKVVRNTIVKAIEQI